MACKERGLIPRLVSALWDELGRRGARVVEAAQDMEEDDTVGGGGEKYRICISYIEIYNENIYDLLDR